MRASAIVAWLQLRRLARARWIALLAVAGIAGAALVALDAARESADARVDALHQGSTTLILLGGLAMAACLGAGALNRDSDSGHFGMLVGAGVPRPGLVAGALTARLILLVLLLAVWAGALQAVAVALGTGADVDLVVHILVTATGLTMVLAATAAASSVVGRVAATVFGLAVYAGAQAMMNLSAAAEQNLIGTAGAGVRAAHAVVPHTPTSPLVADLQERGVGGPAIPAVEINGNEVLLEASGARSIAWTVTWVVLFALLAYAGMRRRPIV